MTRPTKDEYFLNIAKEAATRCTCPRRAVGCVLVDKDDHILSTGYNGPPRRFSHCIDTPCPGVDDPPGQTSRCFAIHAEQNAIIQCLDTTKVHSVYLTVSPCFVCTKMLLNLPNLKRVVFLEPYPDEMAEAMWRVWRGQMTSNIYWHWKP